MKLNQYNKAHDLIKMLATKNGIYLKDIASRMGYSQANELSKILRKDRHLSPEKLTEIIQAINQNYEVNIRFISSVKYRVIVLVKGNPAIVDGYTVEI